MQGHSDTKAFTALRASRVSVALVIGVSILILSPVLAVALIALSPSSQDAGNLWQTVAPRYFQNTAILMLAVAILSAIWGTSTAWLISFYKFPGSKFLEYALFAPLAVPAYVSAYTLTDFLEFAGPLQTGLRNIFGWGSAQD